MGDFLLLNSAARENPLPIRNKFNRCKNWVCITLDSQQVVHGHCWNLLNFFSFSFRLQLWKLMDRPDSFAASLPVKQRDSLWGEKKKKNEKKKKAQMFNGRKNVIIQNDLKTVLHHIFIFIITLETLNDSLNELLSSTPETNPVGHQQQQTLLCNCCCTADTVLHRDTNPSLERWQPHMPVGDARSGCCGATW